MNPKRILLAVLLVVAGGCGDSYYKCLKCGAAYKSPAFRKGFPGQTNTRTCRAIDDSPNQTCDGRLIYCTEADSGWNEGRFQKRGNEIPEGSPW
jgi:hypothetical protein